MLFFSRAEQIILMLCAVTIVVCAGIWVKDSYEQAHTHTVQLAANSLGPDSLTTITVHVAGRVKKPGVYRLACGSRVVDAIQSAGGPASDADLDRLNLAKVLRDGERIEVPSRAAATPVVSGALPTTGTTVNINTASAAELQSLPGIGPALAQRIIRFRTRNGQFNEPEDLLKVKGIGVKTFERLRPYIRLR